MIKSDKIYKVCIDITTFKTGQREANHQYNMNTISTNKTNKCPNKFICSICLNQKTVNENTGTEINERKSKSCPICHSCDLSDDCDSSVTKKSVQKPNNTFEGKSAKVNTRDIHTSEQDVTQGLSLLNEVLSVFQTKKEIGNRKSSGKTLIYKDVGVSTDDVHYRNKTSKLTINKVCQFSISAKDSSNNAFTIVSSCQPEIVFGPRNSVDLIKHKSSSIPQMKLEELKKSLKEKTKSKDAVEEVQRMFATVKRFDPKDSAQDINRPVVRNGPRVLPVVKTTNFEVKAEHDKLTKTDQKICKCGHETNYYMSSGDSSVKQKCCHSCNKCDRCDDCVYMVCCHYKENQKEMNGLICKRCRTKQASECKHRCSKNLENV